MFVFLFVHHVILLIFTLSSFVIVVVATVLFWPYLDSKFVIARSNIHLNYIKSAFLFNNTLHVLPHIIHLTQSWERKSLFFRLDFNYFWLIKFNVFLLACLLFQFCSIQIIWLDVLFSNNLSTFSALIQGLLLQGNHSDDILLLSFFNFAPEFMSGFAMEYASSV